MVLDPVEYWEAARLEACDVNGGHWLRRDESQEGGLALDEIPVGD